MNMKNKVMEKGGQLMYRNHARVYDLIYSFKDYKSEVNDLHKIIQKQKKYICMMLF